MASDIRCCFMQNIELTVAEEEDNFPRDSALGNWTAEEEEQVPFLFPGQTTRTICQWGMKQQSFPSGFMGVSTKTVTRRLLPNKTTSRYLNATSTHVEDTVKTKKWSWDETGIRNVDFITLPLRGGRDRTSKEVVEGQGVGVLDERPFHHVKERN